MKLVEALVEFKDIIFAWSPSNLGIVLRDIAKHKLSIPDNEKWVLKKNSVFSRAMQEIIRKEIHELLVAGSRKSIFPYGFQTR